MYSADRWRGSLDSGRFTYITTNNSELNIEFSDSHHIGNMNFINWWVDKNTIDELIEVLQQVKLYMP